MAYDFKPLKDKIKDISDWLTKECSSIRTGRATPTLLDGVYVEAYGTQMPLNQVANLSVEDARTLRIAPWDVSQTKSIEKAIVDADMGVSVAVDDKGVRVFFPELTSERRAILIKLAKEKLEDARVSLKKERERVWNDIQAQEKAGAMSEDDKFRNKDEMQKHVDEGNTVFEALFAKKEKEISQ